MAIVNSYVKLPEGNNKILINQKSTVQVPEQTIPSSSSIPKKSLQHNNILIVQIIHPSKFMLPFLGS